MIEVSAATEEPDCASFHWTLGYGKDVERLACSTKPNSDQTGGLPYDLTLQLWVLQSAKPGEFFSLRFREVVIPPNVRMDIWATWDDSIEFEVRKNDDLAISNSTSAAVYMPLIMILTATVSYLVAILI